MASIRMPNPLNSSTILPNRGIVNASPGIRIVQLFAFKRTVLFFAISIPKSGNLFPIPEIV
jgi:hypothetical protein